ncbi:B12-binding domain-containing radical SAM protein (plasmid) [Haloimpatiens sp. FM7330]|uniref:B12-binding domain-containing radical SAM protein n=1 Tax=Haloimpatiens sp. FM7330 TaxID=3298610 RepID=UPI00363CB880
MKDILFINTIDNCLDNSSICINLGTLSLATILKKDKYDVEIIDFNYLYRKKYIKYHNEYHKDTDNMVKYILKFNPKIVDFYTMTNSYCTSLLLAKKLKEKRPDIKILFGGPQASLTAIDSMKAFPWIDAIGVGEGELTIKKLVDILLENKSFNNIKGVVYRKNGQVCFNGKESLIEDLDSLPMLDYSLVNVEDLSAMPLDVGRGCPFGCIYCSTKTFWQRYFRLKSSERIIREIKFVIDNYGIRTFNFVHDIFTVNKLKVMEFCDLLLKNKINIKWRCSARIDTLDEEMIKKMKESGCESIYLGIETGSERMQKIINKNLNLSDVKSKIKILNKYKIEVTASFIYGFPGETIDNVRETLRLIDILRKEGVKHTQLHLLGILPGTELYEKLKDKLVFSNNISDISNDKTISCIPKNIILKNKSVFCQYFDFDSELRSTLIYLDKFNAVFYSFLFNNMFMTYKILMEYYNNELLDFFLDFKEVNYNILSDSEDITKIKNIIDALKRFVFTKDFDKYTSLVREIFKFEINIFNFMYFDNIKEKKFHYMYNVYDIKKNGILDDITQKKPIEIKITRIKDCHIKLEKVV